MKKIVSSIILFSLLTFGMPMSAKDNKATLINKYSGQRVIVTIGTWPATGVWEIYKEGYLGYSVATGYKTVLSSSINSTASTISVSSMATSDGHTLTMADLGSRVFLTLEPGSTAKQEIVMCTGISSNTWTGCTRGLAFYGTSTSAVAANRKSHSSGSAVVMSNVHYVYDELIDKDTTQTIDGDTTFTNSITVDSMVLGDGTLTGVTVTPASSDLTSVANVQYVNSVATSGAPNASLTVKGIVEVADGTEFGNKTVLGATGAYLTPPNAFFATSTPGGASQVWGVVTRYDTGLIDPSFYQGNTNTWSATNTFSGPVTFSNTATYGAGFTHIQVITGSSSWTKPSGVYKIRVKVVGGGGSGVAGSSKVGSGGGGGGYAEKIIDVTATSSVFVTVGAAGGTSSFGTYASSTGGSIGNAGDVNYTNNAGGAGGVGSGGDINISGSAGSPGVGLAGQSAVGGNGGSSVLGGGGLGCNTAASGNCVGGAGGNYGGGGGGGIGASGSGGTGANGVVIVEY